MKKIITIMFFAAAVFSLFAFNLFNKNSKSVIETKQGLVVNDNINDVVVKDINGNDVKLSDYNGKVLLIVNVASKCGYTRQYEGLQKLYEKYNAQGFEILAFPCNDFGGQEPGTNEEIKEFCSVNYSVTFPLFDKVKVLGEERSPLYEKLINNPGTEQGDVKWNFEKFLISRDGEIKARFRSKAEPLGDEIISAVEAELNVQ